MTTWYVDSTATGTNAGTSWANACTTFATLLGKAIVSGDDVNVYSGHNETTAAAVTLAWPGTAAAPNRIFSCDKTNTPAQASDLVAGAKMSTTGASTIEWNGSFYAFGITLNAGSAANTASVTFGQFGTDFQVWDTCSFVLNNTSASSLFGPGTLSDNEFVWTNCTVQFGAVGQSIRAIARLRWYDTVSALGGATFPTTLFSLNSTSTVLLSGIDLSALGSGKTIVGNGAVTANYLLLNCRLGASVTVSATPTVLGASKVDLVNCDFGATGYRQERYWYNGTLKTSTTVYNNATDGVTPISWQVVTTANSKRQAPFECFEIVQWVPAGTYAASAIQITSATASLTNADVWVDTQYLGNASYPLASLVSSSPATQLTAGSTLAAGSWAVGGLGNNYQLAIPSFTVAIAGYARFVVKVAKASLTVNIDPAVTVA